MDSRLREMAARWRKKSDTWFVRAQESGDRLHLGLSDAYATVADELLAHIESLEREQSPIPPQRSLTPAEAEGVAAHRRILFHPVVELGPDSTQVEYGYKIGQPNVTENHPSEAHMDLGPGDKL